MTIDGNSDTLAATPAIIPRPEHGLSRASISPNALKVLYRLHEAGYQACLVGGGVRDLLLGREPKDFDVATSAHPEDVRHLFRNCRLIGRRFRLAHVHFGREIIEVATFRALDDGEDNDERHIEEDGRILRDNVYGDIEDDAWRRDFTVNALYYNIADYSVMDYVGGMEDLRNGLLRLIGDPETRYREDPVRMLRAVRFAAKLGFRIHPDSEAPMAQLGVLLEDIPAARLYEEVLKLFLSGTGLATFEALRHYNLFGHLFPSAEESLAVEEEGYPHTLLSRALASTDERVNSGKPVTPAFLFAAILWEPMRLRAIELQDSGEMTAFQAIQAAGADVVRDQARFTSVPRRFSLPMRDIWMLQGRLEQNSGRRAIQLLGHPRFRAAYDFLLLRAEANEVPQELCDWWTEFQQLSPEERERRVTGGASRKPNRRRRRPRKRES